MIANIKTHQDHIAHDHRMNHHNDHRITDRHWPFTLQDLALVGGRRGLGDGRASESRGARCRVVRTKCGRGADDLRRPWGGHMTIMTHDITCT